MWIWFLNWCCIHQGNDYDHWRHYLILSSMKWEKKSSQSLMWSCPTFLISQKVIGDYSYKRNYQSNQKLHLSSLHHGISKRGYELNIILINESHSCLPTQIYKSRHIVPSSQKKITAFWSHLHDNSTKVVDQYIF